MRASAAFLGLVASVSLTQFTYLPSFWNHGIIVVTLTEPVKAEAILDTGGYTEDRKGHPHDFDTYYHGLPVDVAIGPDYLVRHRVAAGQTSGAKETVPLDVRKSPQWTLAFVRCTAAGQNVRMLLDTAALAWRPQDASHDVPAGVTFAGKTAYATLAHAPGVVAGPPWQIVNEKGAFVREPSIVVPSIACGGVKTANATVVERSDDTTYAAMHKAFGFTVDGDIGLAGLNGDGWTIDFPGKTLTVYPNSLE